MLSINERVALEIGRLAIAIHEKEFEIDTLEEKVIQLRNEINGGKVAHIEKDESPL